MTKKNKVQLLHEEQILIFKFLCVLAWADFRIHPAERKFIEDLAEHFEVDLGIQQMIKGWLQHPPRPEEVDPYSIPQDVLEIILEQSSLLAKSDGNIDFEELEIIELLHSLCS